MPLQIINGPKKELSAESKKASGSGAEPYCEICKIIWNTWNEHTVPVRAADEAKGIQSKVLFAGSKSCSGVKSEELENVRAYISFILVCAAPSLFLGTI